MTDNLVEDVPKVERDHPTLAGEDDHKFKIFWPAVVFLSYVHVAGIHGLLAHKTIGTYFVQIFMMYFGGLGMTVGAHQYFTHHSFKANKKLKALLVFMWSTAMYSIHDYVQYHRLHHKYNDTNADPHNTNRGYFFAHIGWSMVDRHPEFIKFSKKLNMNDILTDKLAMFQHRHVFLLGLLTGFALPISISCFFFGDSFATAWNFNCLRFLIVLHLAAATNSVSHFYGYRPFEKDISATDSYIMGTITLGGGWHNFHHTFPWDYKTSEMPTYWCNLSLAFVDFFAWLGWATDLKTVNRELVIKRARRTGDGSRKYDDIIGDEKLENDVNVWGWTDSAMSSEERNCATILYQSSDKSKIS